MMKQLTIIIRHSPYKTYLAEVQDLILAQSAFFESLNVIFTGDGILQLLNKQAKTDIQKNHSKTYETFALYDIENIYIDKESLNQLQIDHDHLIINAAIISASKIQKILNQSDFVLNY